MVMLLDKRPETLRVSEPYKNRNGIFFAARGNVFEFDDGIRTMELSERPITQCKKFEREGLEVCGKVKKLYSPKELPPFTFPFAHQDALEKIEYIQFTSSTIVYSDGVFFADGDVQETHNENLCMCKDGNVWRIWHKNQLYTTDGERIWDDKIPFEQLEDKYPCFLSSINGVVITAGDNSIVIHKVDYSRIPHVAKYYPVQDVQSVVFPRNIFERLHVMYKGKRIYVPRHLIRDLEGDI